MALDNKLDGMKDQATGKVKEVAGKVTGNSQTEAEGMVEGVIGKAEEKFEVVKEEAGKMPIMTTIFVTVAVAAITTIIFGRHKKN